MSTLWGKKIVPHFFQSQVLHNSTDSQSCCWCKSMDSSLPGDFQRWKHRGNRFGWFRWGFSLGKRRGEKGVFSGLGQEDAGKNIERWNPNEVQLPGSLCRVKPARNLKSSCFFLKETIQESKSCEAPKIMLEKKPSWVWLCNKILGWWHDIFW